MAGVHSPILTRDKSFGYFIMLTFLKLISSKSLSHWLQVSDHGIDSVSTSTSSDETLFYLVDLDPKRVGVADIKQAIHALNEVSVLCGLNCSFTCHAVWLQLNQERAQQVDLNLQKANELQKGAGLFRKTSKQVSEKYEKKNSWFGS